MRTSVRVQLKRAWVFRRSHLRSSIGIPVEDCAGKGGTRAPCHIPMQCSCSARRQPSARVTSAWTVGTALWHRVLLLLLMMMMLLPACVFRVWTRPANPICVCVYVCARYG